jgi:hypothetical protein
MSDKSKGSNEGYHEIPVDVCIYLGDKFGAVNYAFLKVYTPTLLIFASVSTAILCLTDWWQRLFMYLYFGSAWYVGWIGTALFTGIVYFKLHRRSKRRRQQQKDSAHKRRVEKGLISLGEGR